MRIDQDGAHHRQPRRGRSRSARHTHTHTTRVSNHGPPVNRRLPRAGDGRFHTFRLARGSWHRGPANHGRSS